MPNARVRELRRGPRGRLVAGCEERWSRLKSRVVRSSRDSLWITPTFAVIMAVFLPMVLLAEVLHPRMSVSLVLVWVTLAYSAVRLAVLGGSRRKRLVATTFWAFNYVFMGVAPFLQVASDAFPRAGVYDPALLLRTELIVITAYAAFELGYLVSPAETTHLAGRIGRSELRRSTVATFGVLALVVTAIVVYRLGGVALLFASRVERQHLLTSQFSLPVLNLLKSFISVPIFIALAASLVVRFSGRLIRGLRRRVLWAAFDFTLLLAVLLVDNPVGTPRYLLGTIAFSMLFLLPWKRWSSAFNVAVVVAGLLLVFPFAALFRQSTNVEIGNTFANVTLVGHLVHSGDFDAFQQVANSVIAVDSEGVHAGRQLLGSLFFFVPRSLWESKPRPTGEVVAQSVGYTYTNLSEPLWAEFYIDGGFVLVALGMVVYGGLAGRLDRSLRKSDRTAGARLVSLVVPIFAGFQVFLLRGALMPAVADFAPMMLFSLVCVAPSLVRVRKRQAPGPSARRAAVLLAGGPDTAAEADPRLRPERS